MSCFCGILTLLYSKGQLISKCLFGVFNFFHKPVNENKSTSNKVKFVCLIFWKERRLEKIEFVWPLNQTEKPFSLLLAEAVSNSGNWNMYVLGKVTMISSLWQDFKKKLQLDLHETDLHWYENQNKNNLAIMLRKSREIN